MFIYAETALHHEGNFDYLLKLIDCAKESGASGVKFQVTINQDEVMSTRHSIYDMCKKMLLSEKECMPFDANRSGLNLGEGSAFLVLH